MNKIYYATRTLCPTCDTLLPGKVERIDGAVYVTRTCPQHGHFKGLISSDAGWFEDLERFDVTPVKPRGPARPTQAGCPVDCGLCVRHRQIAGTAAIEISNHCNAKCPVCLADNRGTFELSADEVRAAVEALFERQDHLGILTLSGGEPTIHPELFEILDAVTELRVPRIVINSNGIRIASDDAFLDRLAAYDNVYVSLHFDGSQARRLRGSAPSVQENALDRLIRRGIDCAPVVLAASGVNEDELGTIAAGLLRRSSAIKTVILSMMTYAGPRGSVFEGHPERRLTIPEALQRMEANSGGVFHLRDFIPLPMPNPMCAAVGYFLTEGAEIIPLIPLAGVERTLEYLANYQFAEANEAFERYFRDTIDSVYAHPSPGSERALTALRNLVRKLFPSGRSLPEAERRALVEQHIRSVYLMQFMDKWTFDSVRLSKCSCQHLLPDGNVIPSCGYYAYHRQFDPRFAEEALP